MDTLTRHRVAITGLGIITSVGETVPEFRTGIFTGECGIGPISLFDTTGFSCHRAGQVKRKDIAKSFEKGEIKRASRCDLLGLIAAQEALADSGINLERCDRNNIGIIMGGGAGGMLTWEKFRRAACRKKELFPSLLLPVS